MFVVRTPMLLGTYLPVLIGVGMLVGSLTGIVTDRVLRSMHLTAEEEKAQTILEGTAWAEKWR